MSFMGVWRFLFSPQKAQPGKGIMIIPDITAILKKKPEID